MSSLGINKLLLLFFQCVRLAFCQIYNLHGRPGEGYILDVVLGTPPQKFNVLIDTGSSNFAIAAASFPEIESYYNASKSKTMIDLKDVVSVEYTQGNWSGHLISDMVYFPALNSVPAVRCHIALITDSKEFFMKGAKWQGILGVAYPSISRPNSNYLSWIDALQITNGDRTMAFSLTLCGAKSIHNSELYGSFEILNNVVEQYDDLYKAPVVRDWFYEVIVTSIRIHDKKINIDCKNLEIDKTIVDSGTTNLRLPPDLYHDLVTLVSEHAKSSGPLVFDDFWTTEKLSCWPQMQDWSLLPPIHIDIATSNTEFFTLHLPGTSYIRQAYGFSSPRPDPHDEPEYCYKFAVEPSESGIVLGTIIMEGYQVIFNRTGRTVGFRKSHCGPDVDISGPYHTNSTNGSLIEMCIEQDTKPLSMLTITAYVVSTLLVVITCLFAYLFVQWLKDKYFRCDVEAPSISLSHTSLITEDT